MGKVDEYRALLNSLSGWDAFLLANSRLPGPRANIELGLAAAEGASRTQIRKWLSWDAESAPDSSPEEFLAFCGVLGLGRFAVEGREDAMRMLRRHACDSRWRIREGVALALQRVGRSDFDRLLRHMRVWIEGTRLEQRAAIAGLCEPALLSDRLRVKAVLDILEVVTSSVASSDDRRSKEYRVLRKALGYCWSVAVAADPAVGKPAIEPWISEADEDVRWVTRENLKKNRLSRIDAEWVAAQREVLATR